MTTIGLVGLGLIGSRRLEIARALGCEIAFAVDPDRSRQGALGLDGGRFATDISTLHSDRLASVDAIFVAVPHHLTLSVCRWALECGADVLCEKPTGISADEARTIRSLVKQHGAKFCAGFNFRFLPTVAALRDLVAFGRLGEIQRVRINMGHGGRPGMEREWKLGRAQAGGGAIIDPGIHLLDLVRYLFGEPVVVGCELRRHFWDVDVEDDGSIRLTCGAAHVTIEVSLTYWKNIFALEVYGREGFAAAHGRGGNYGTQTIEYVNRWFWNGNDQRLRQDFGTDDRSFELETRAFLDWVAGASRDPALSTIDDGVAGLRLVEDIYAQGASRARMG